LISSSIQAGDSTTFKVNITPNNPNVIVGDVYRDMAYTREFSKRFSLPLEKIEKLEPGLQAIGFRVETATGVPAEINTHICYIDLFFNKDVNISYPEKFGQGGYSIYENIFQYELDTYKDSPEFDKTRLKYLSKAVVRNTNVKSKKRHSEYGLTMRVYKKDVLKGINFFSFQTTECGVIAAPVDWMKTEIIIQRDSTNKDVNNTEKFTTKDFFIFKIPPVLHKRICPTVEKIAYLSSEKMLNVSNPDLKKWYQQEKIQVNKYDPSCN